VAGAVPPTGLVLLSVGSVQLGAAIAKGLFDQLGPTGTVFLRVGFATLALLLLWRPPLGGYARGGYLVAIAFALPAMNLSLYLHALHRRGRLARVKRAREVAAAGANRAHPLDLYIGMPRMLCRLSVCLSVTLATPVYRAHKAR
jgi:hypothetical protein